MIRRDSQHRLLILFCVFLITTSSLNASANESVTSEANKSTVDGQSPSSNNEADIDSNDEKMTLDDDKNEIDTEIVEKTKADTKPQPSFDIDELVKRMKKTDAIGFITKLSLKNQVDDLLEEVEKAQTNNSINVERKIMLRENFEGIILKTITLLNKGEDYPLAEDIYQAREQIWNSILENKA